MSHPNSQIKLFLLFDFVERSANWMSYPDYFHLMLAVVVIVGVGLKFSRKSGFSSTSDLSKVARFNSFFAQM